eukprot:2131026-Rhodomonas_salina.3
MSPNRQRSSLLCPRRALTRSTLHPRSACALSWALASTRCMSSQSPKPTSDRTTRSSRGWASRNTTRSQAKWPQSPWSEAAA